MSESLPVVKVKHKLYGIEMLINESDFNSEVHEKIGEKSKIDKKKKDKDVDDEIKALMGE